MKEKLTRRNIPTKTRFVFARDGRQWICKALSFFNGLIVEKRGDTKKEARDKANEALKPYREEQERNIKELSQNPPASRWGSCFHKPWPSAFAGGTA